MKKGLRMFLGLVLGFSMAFNVYAEPAYHASVTATLAATAYQLSTSTSIRYKYLTIQASLANTGIIYVGTSSITTANSIELQAGDSITFKMENGMLANHYILASVAGETVRYTYN